MAFSEEILTDDLVALQHARLQTNFYPIFYQLFLTMSPSSEVERMEKSRVLSASVVDSLMNAMMCTRPDIAQAVGVVSRFMAGLVESSEVLTRGP